MTMKNSTFRCFSVAVERQQIAVQINVTSTTFVQTKKQTISIRLIV